MTERSIDMHPELKEILIQWRTEWPKGQFLLDDPTPHKPVNPDKANQLFRQPLRKTSWCLSSVHEWFILGFHVYRHSFASNLAAVGVDQRIIDEWMVHTTLEMQKRYRHLFPSNRQKSIQLLSFATEAPRQ